jgi:hypothetical protein
MPDGDLSINRRLKLIPMATAEKRREDAMQKKASGQTQ